MAWRRMWSRTPRLALTPVGGCAPLKVVSFSLYGAVPKYCVGMERNAWLVRRHMPGWQVWVFAARDVPSAVRDRLAAQEHVRVIDVGRVGRMTDRFTAIDDARVEIMVVRDADSRVTEREAACVRAFEQSRDALLHIIRDHRGHRRYPMLGGMWGIKRAGMARIADASAGRGWFGSPTMATLIADYTRHYYEDAAWIPLRRASGTLYGLDQRFLATCVFPHFRGGTVALVHDELGADHAHEPTSERSAFPTPLRGLDFVGQSYDEHDRPLFALTDFA